MEGIERYRATWFRFFVTFTDENKVDHEIRTVERSIEEVEVLVIRTGDGWAVSLDGEEVETKFSLEMPRTNPD